jgi:hypothetical protein
MRTRYTVGQIEAVREALRKVPPTDRKLRQMSKQSAIAALADDIRQLRRKGHTLDGVAAFLSEKGVEVTTETLKNYLYRLRTRARAQPAKSARAAPASPRKSRPVR